MKTTLTKVSLAALLAIAFVGTALAQTPTCPTLVETLNQASQPWINDGDTTWMVSRDAPKNAFYSPAIWESLVVFVREKDIENANKAMKRGQKILDSSWWGAPIAVRRALGDNYYFVCDYVVDDAFKDFGDQVRLISYTFLSNAAEAMRSSGSGASNQKTMTQDMKDKMQKLKH